MKVLEVIPAFYPATWYGGYAFAGLGLCEALTRSGVEVRVLTTDANRPNQPLTIDTTHTVNMESGLRVRYCHRWFSDTVSPTLLHLLPSYVQWADVVHLTGIYSFPTIPTLLTCKVLGKPVVWSPRGSLQRWHGYTRKGLKTIWEWVCRGAAPKRLVLHMTSTDEATESRDRFPGVPMAVIPNGVEIPSVVAYVPCNDIFRLLFLGRLHPKKGIENLLQACTLLAADKNFKWALTIAGGGEQSYVDSLVMLIRKLGLTDSVAFAGEVVGSAKQRVFEHSDLLVVPSHTENFANVVAEGLAHSVPVIASKGTPWKQVEEMGCGLWIDNDPETLAKTIRYMRDLPLREMGQKGRAWMIAEYSWDRMAPQMIRLYRELQSANAG